MKKILVVAFVAVYSLSSNAQDVLVRKGGEVENVKVLEVSPTEVKYKKSNNEDGPVFIEKRSNIYSIKYKNGDVQLFYNESEQKGSVLANSASPNKTGIDNSNMSSTSVYSNYGKEKKFSHDIDFYVRDAWGIGYQFRKEISSYFGWNIIGVSYMSDFDDITDVGIVNVRALGIRLSTPDVKTVRFFADLRLGYSFVYANFDFPLDHKFSWLNGTRYRGNFFGLDFSPGIQFCKYYSVSYNLNFLKNGDGKILTHWGKFTITI
ncbi:MAG: hypothetical protein IKU02_10325 [Bacteroidaceae bacterium]|nr:hypothetical protein [Bacteroidaceae bacterium]